MTQLALAAFVFVAMHILPAISARDAIVRKIGDPAYMGLFSLASFLGLAWLAHAYVQAPASEPLWITGQAVRWCSAIVMLVAFTMLVCGVFTKNPTSVLGKGALKGRNEWNDIFAITRHPVMWAVAIWAAVHLVNRPDAASLLFFGSLAFLAIAGTLRQEARKRAELGAAWDKFASQTSFVPFAGLLSGKARLNWRELADWPLAIAVFLWAAMLHFHGTIFGVYPVTF